MVLAAALGQGGCEASFEATDAAEARPRQTSAWPEYGGGGGQRYADLTGIDASNVDKLEVAWVYRTGDQSDGSGPEVPSTTAFEVTPILADGALVFCTPFNRVVALDPLTGGQIWSNDPGVDLGGHYANQLVCRGVAHWRGAGAGACSSRIFTATNDGYLVAIDARTGRFCGDFGDAGFVNLNRGVGAQQWLGEYQVTSPPAVIGDLVVVGAAVSDNERIDAPSGVIRAFHAETGAQVWAWDLAPPDFDYDDPEALVSDEGFALGTPNVWGVMTADPSRDLLYVPTGNPAPDYYRGGTPDMDHYGSAVVALRGSTGEVVWTFNTVLNDFWDYDVGAQPTLTEVDLDGRRVPALIQGTKMGFVFVLDPASGRPLVDVDWREVPRLGPLSEQLAPRQPFPPEAFRVAPEVSLDDAWGLTFWDRGQCRKAMASMRMGPVYTPITEEWTVVAPSNAGGINWGGVAVDPVRGIVVARSTNLPFQIKLIPRDEFDGGRTGHEFDVETAPQRGMPYAMARAPLLSPLGLPCVRPPWGLVSAIDLSGRRLAWQRPHGSVTDLAPVPVPWELGVPGLGQAVLTASGLAFIGGSMEHAIRAYDVESGEQLWHHRLPAAATATPMSYTVTGESGAERQFVVIAAGGYPSMGVDVGDYLVAFALPES